MNHIITRRSLVRNFAALTLGALLVTPAAATLLDDFNAAQRTGWEDSNPGGLPIPGGQQASGVFTFALPTIGQSFFVNSTKISPEFELKEGRTIEFRVDMISGLGGNSYGVLAFMPTANGPNALAGYGIAKSETDTLITKGINQYFIDDDTTVVKNANVTLVLNLRAQGGNVYINGRVLDKDANNAVIWERSFVDTPAADPLDGGATENPTTPYITKGKFVLYLFANGGTDPGYQVVFDNAKHFVTEVTLTDDFNAAQRTGWEDSNPGGLPLPGGVQGGGVFTFDLPTIGQSFFINSTKITKQFTLTEGTRHEFSVDMISGRGIDSFTVLGFMPTVPGPNALAGYGIAKSESDILVTKGINQYYIDDSNQPWVKNTNVKLVLTLTVEDGVVTIRGRVLDNDNNGAVLWDRTFLDTAGPDPLEGGATENPAQPYTNKVGNVVLYLYGDAGTDPAGYQVVVDNLAVAEPPVEGNVPPIISGVAPVDGAAFLSAPVTLSFKAADDKPLPDSGFSVIINDKAFTTANGLTLSGSTTDRTVTLSAGTGANSNYIAKLIVVDADNAAVTNILYFDTFTSVNPVLEIEDYNFGNGQYINNPVPGPEYIWLPEGYAEQTGVEGVDFHETRTTPNGADTMYRSQDPVRMQHTLDQSRAKYDPANMVFGYDVGDVATGEWLNYTRDFVAGTYEVYLRQSTVGLSEGESVLEKVTSDPSLPDQTVSPLGSFLAKTTGYTFRNVALTDGSGLNKLVLSLSGKTTLRLRQVTADTDSGARYQNYLVFVPVEASGIQRAIVSSVQPAPDSTTRSVMPVIDVTILNRDTTVNTASVKLEVNGQQVNATVTATASGATVNFPIDPLPAKDVPVQAKVSFKDNTGTDISVSWQFVVTYALVDPKYRVPGTGKDRGFAVHVKQAQIGENTDNSLTFAENLLKTNTTYLVQYDTNVVAPVINFSQNGPGTAEGSFPEDELIPGLDVNYSSDDIAMEAITYLELPAGKYRMGATCDDGYKVHVVGDPQAIAFRNGEPANESYDFVVTQSGLYPFRMVWYERGGGAHVEWWQSSLTSATRSLLNTNNVAGVVKAYRTFDAPVTAEFTSVRLQNGQLTITWTGTGTLMECTSLAQKNWTPVAGNPSGTYTVPVGTAAGAKFYGIAQ